MSSKREALKQGDFVMPHSPPLSKCRLSHRQRVPAESTKRHTLPRFVTYLTFVDVSLPVAAAPVKYLVWIHSVPSRRQVSLELTRRTMARLGRTSSRKRHWPTGLPPKVAGPQTFPGICSFRGCSSRRSLA